MEEIFDKNIVIRNFAPPKFRKVVPPKNGKVKPPTKKDGTGRRTQIAELLLHPCPRLRQRLLTRPDGTHAAQAQAAGHHMKENEQNYDASIKCFNFVTHHL